MEHIGIRIFNHKVKLKNIQILYLWKGDNSVDKLLSINIIENEKKQTNREIGRWVLKLQEYYINI
jgi:hypothetical protein